MMDEVMKTSVKTSCSTALCVTLYYLKGRLYIIMCVAL